ncbi:hypothetical protein [Rufibacter tibetensis]|uniref:DUF4595 domain-containing protein n=1 Tax=Rufibacter tibetensis TaxID=512763 RepID=A0A0N7HWF9_9BACT|nr:hypothetical protein [Rufibacter tibetensis]ALI99136.1 hypothetical protein DC20_09315 [Rufibacter tibetensis]
MKACCITLTVFFAALFLAGCDLEDPEPNIHQPRVLLKKIATTQGDSREFQYAASGWLARVVGKGQLALNENEQTTSEIIYDNMGRVAYVLTDGPTLDTENAYYYTADNKLYKLDELINGKVESYHTFEYDTQKRLTARYSHYKDVTINTPREANKVTYTYDAKGNVGEVKMYHKPTATSDWQLVQTSTYENYDTKKSVQHLSDFLFTPRIILHGNNPGKVTTTLASGEQRVTTFTYEYNEQNLPVKKTTTPSNGTAFQTEYTYLM